MVPKQSQAQGTTCSQNDEVAERLGYHDDSASDRRVGATFAKEKAWCGAFLFVLVKEERKEDSRGNWEKTGTYTPQTAGNSPSVPFDSEEAGRLQQHCES